MRVRGFIRLWSTERPVWLRWGSGGKERGEWGSNGIRKKWQKMRLRRRKCKVVALLLFIIFMGGL